MNITVREATQPEIEQVIPLLLLAEPWEPALRWGLEHLSDAVYRMDEDGQMVGAVSVQWRGDPCEIEELGVDPARQGQGLGRQLVEWVIEEARRRSKSAVLVGTPNASIGNIAFYQRLGFRMDHIRKDYFRYYRSPRYENGIQVRDLLVFRYDLGKSKQQSQRSRRT
jgi:GNAT superfamily N-acetyltransferase